MSPRTRSDLLAASSGYAKQRAAEELLRSAKHIDDVGRRVLLDALEFAIEHARAEVDDAAKQCDCPTECGFCGACLEDL
jgi:hypothetical protein